MARYSWREDDPGFLPAPYWPAMVLDCRGHRLPMKYFFRVDTETGEVWHYEEAGGGGIELDAFGNPMVRVSRFPPPLAVLSLEGASFA